MNIKRSRPWQCKSARPPATCSSTNSLSFAAGVPDVIRSRKLSGLSEKSVALAFSGIHVISPRLLGNDERRREFSRFSFRICVSPAKARKSSLFAPMNITGEISANRRMSGRRLGICRRKC